MNDKDRARYGGVRDTESGIRDTGKSRKRDADERREQGEFANWLLLQNSQGRKIPFVWHATHTRSKATPGTPDFWVGINGRSLWIEFKRDESCKLSPEQNEFRLACEAQQIEWHVVHSAKQAIQIMQKADAVISLQSIAEQTSPAPNQVHDHYASEIGRLVIDEYFFGVRPDLCIK